MFEFKLNFNDILNFHSMFLADYALISLLKHESFNFKVVLFCMGLFACCVYVLGYDSDDDEYMDSKKSRWNKGRTYKSLPTNQEELAGVSRVGGADRHLNRSPQYPGLSYNRYAGSSNGSRGPRPTSPTHGPNYSDTVQETEAERPQRASPVNSSLNTSQDTDEEYELVPVKPGTYQKHGQDGGTLTYHSNPALVSGSCTTCYNPLCTATQSLLSNVLLLLMVLVLATSTYQAQRT